jgi:flagellar biosynthesis/type III secretory pathway protein FliH
VIKLVYELLTILATRQNQEADRDDEELIVTLTQLYEEAIAQLREEGRQEGRQEGEEQATVRFITNLLRVRFGEVDEELRAIVGRIAALPSEEFTPLVLQLSREELLRQFTTENE